jgi:hypothetical protein
MQMIIGEQIHSSKLLILAILPTTAFSKGTLSRTLYKPSRSKPTDTG